MRLVRVHPGVGQQLLDALVEAAIRRDEEGRAAMKVANVRINPPIGEEEFDAPRMTEDGRIMQ